MCEASYTSTYMRRYDDPVIRDPNILSNWVLILGNECLGLRYFAWGARQVFPLTSRDSERAKCRNTHLMMDIMRRVYIEELKK